MRPLFPLSSLLERLSSEQPVEPLLAVANHWRGALFPLDRAKAAVERLSDAAAAARKEELSNPSALYAIQAAADSLTDVLAGVYPAIRDGRERLYGAAQFWGLPVPRTSGTATADALSGHSRAELYADLKSAASSVLSDLKGMDRAGKDCLDKLYAAARTPPKDSSERKEVLDAAIDFRDAANNLFLHALTLLRRAHELVVPTAGDRWAAP